jgi:hypothetical protein
VTRTLCRWACLIGAIAVLQACGLTREVRPVGQGKFAAGVSLGGPVFMNLGAPIPTPVISAYGRYGILQKLDLDFALDITPAKAQGLDVGVAYLFRDQNGAIPAVMGGGRAYVFVNGKAFLGGTDVATGNKYSLSPSAFEEIYANASWKLGKPWLLYAGLDLFSQVEQAAFRPSILVGAEYRFTHVGIGAELRQEAFATNQEFSTFSYIGPGHWGALAFLLGVNIYPAGAP